MTSPNPSPQERVVIDDWAKIVLGSPLAGRYVLDGGNKPEIGHRGIWRSDPPRIDRLAPDMTVRLGELVFDAAQSLKDYEHPWLWGLAQLARHAKGLTDIRTGKTQLPPFDTIVEAARQQGLDPDQLMAHLFDPQRKYSLAAFPGFTGWLCQHADIFRTYLTSDEWVTHTALQKLEAVELMLFADDIANELTCRTATRARYMWRHADRLGYELLAAPLEAIATGAEKPAIQAEALRALYRLASDPLDREALRNWCDATFTADDAPSSVAQALRHIAPEPVDFSYELPTIDYDLQPEPELYERLATAFAMGRGDGSDKFRAKYLNEGALEEAWEMLQGLEIADGNHIRTSIHLADEAMPFLDDLPAAVQLRARQPRDWRFQRPFSEIFAADPGISPLALWLLVQRHWPEWTPDRILQSGEWSDAECAPLVMHELDYFIDRIPAKAHASDRPGRINGNVPQWRRPRKSPFALLPALPRKAYEKLLRLGLQGSASAWRTVGDQDDLHNDLVAALSSGKWLERRWAATWLAHRGDPRAAGPILERYRKEKHLEARFAMIEALDALGEPPENYLDETSVMVEAAKAVAKPLPASLDWLDFDALPQLRWSDGRPAHPAVGSLLILQATGLKRTHPTAMARSLLERMDPVSAQLWCDHLFHTWITADQHPVPHQEALAEATTRAEWHLRGIENGHRSSTDAKGEPYTHETLVAHYLPIFGKQPRGSEAKSRGVLSLVSVAGSESVVEPSTAYLRRFYGKRIHQARAILEMLSHIDAPSAAPALLSISHRFRTKSLQDLAAELAEQLAARKGWTLDDLRWRSVPDGGFDRLGFLSLDFGGQTFIASIADDLNVQLNRDDGTPLKKLPAPRVSDDPEMAGDAKKDFNAAKKALRTLAKELPSRLHEAMSIRREWDSDEFRRYVLDHPVQRMASTRLVWQQGDDRSNTRLFRPDHRGDILDVDGSKSGLDDRPIVIAHGSLMHADERQAWTDHLATHAVRPWFDQFSHTTHRPLVDQQDRFDHFQGAMFNDDAKFVSRLTRLGWLRGEDRDGAFLRNMVKRFSAAGLEAHLNVGGLGVTLYGGPIVVLNVLFRDGASYAPVPLNGVPRILLIETLAEVESFVAKADSHDPSWHSNEYFQRRHNSNDVRPDLVAAQRG